VQNQTAVLTVPEVAEILRVSRPRAYEMVNTGQIPGVIRLGERGIRISRQKFEKWLQDQTR